MWIEHPELALSAHVPDESLPGWLARGWQPCDPQPEPETVLPSPLPPAVEPEPVVAGPTVEHRAEVAPAFNRPVEPDRPRRHTK